LPRTVSGEWTGEVVKVEVDENLGYSVLEDGDWCEGGSMDGGTMA
jgi:hypothetical protein